MSKRQKSGNCKRRQGKKRFVNPVLGACKELSNCPEVVKERREREEGGELPGTGSISSFLSFLNTQPIDQCKPDDVAKKKGGGGGRGGEKRGEKGDVRRSRLDLSLDLCVFGNRSFQA